MKYGSLASDRGKLDISWNLFDGGEGKSFQLSWTESGGPAISVPSRRGFGSTVIRSSIERQLGGMLELDWAREGLRCHIKLPLDQLSESSVSTSPEPPLEQTRGISYEFPSAGGSVLIVEDEPLIWLEMQQTVEAIGCDVLGPASSVSEALEILRRRRPDIAILDVNLAGEYTDSIARALTALGVPFVFCTGYADPMDLSAVAGSAERLEKPVDAAVLTNALKRMLAEAAMPAS